MRLDSFPSSRSKLAWLNCIALGCMLWGMATTIHADAPSLRVEQREDRVLVFADSVELFQYVFRDSALPRPYFAHVKTLSGKQVTRNHPPKKDVDRSDHADMHPGIWISFGDLNGNDYWRLKAPTVHQRFLSEPKIVDQQLHFSVLNHYLGAAGSVDAERVVCEQKCSVCVRLLDGSYLISLENDFSSPRGPLRFGDQEEMGIGVRVATPIAVDGKLGGRIRDSEGRLNGEQIWGKAAAWCDYAGPLDSSWCGMTVLTSPKNFRSCWSHARDYGFVAMNPFGLNAFTKAPREDITVAEGSSLRFDCAVVVHESPRESDYKPQVVYEKYERMLQQSNR